MYACKKVVLQAGLRGIPAVTSDHGGLPEANPVARLVINSPLRFNMKTRKLYRDGEDPANPPARRSIGNLAAFKGDALPGMIEALEAANEDEVAGYAAALLPLVSEPSELQRASDDAFGSAQAWVSERQPAFRNLLHSTCVIK